MFKQIVELCKTIVVAGYRYLILLLNVPLLIFGNWQHYAWLAGQARLAWGFCPFCNSDAPAKYNCPVCRNYHGKTADAKTKAIWERNFRQWLYQPDCWARCKIS